MAEQQRPIPLTPRPGSSDERDDINPERIIPSPFLCREYFDEDGRRISAFMEIAHFGEPKIEIITQKSREGRETILAANVVRSALCGSTWYVAKRMTGLETDQSDLRERIAEAHHAYPCTASMDQDPKLKNTTLHKAGYIIREVEEAIKRAERSVLKGSGTFFRSAKAMGLVCE